MLAHMSLKRFAEGLLSPPPRHLSRNQITLDAVRAQGVEDSIRRNFHRGWRNAANYSQHAYESDLQTHLHGALERDRRTVIPWFDSARPLGNLRILELGCGTGSSTVALAEQGARVTAIDLDEGSLQVARDRCAIYNLEVEFLRLSATDIEARFGANSFDFIVFSASLEHMTGTERIAALKAAWNVLPRGGILAVVDTPNRLWYFDEHTSMLPFFHWLPNDLAFQYSRYSPRENFAGQYDEYNSSTETEFLRRGRGVSFHEFDIALKPSVKLKVLSSLGQYRGIARRLVAPPARRRFKAMLMTFCSGVHEGFFEPTLNLMIEKDD